MNMNAAELAHFFLTRSTYPAPLDTPSLYVTNDTRTCCVCSHSI